MLRPNKKRSKWQVASLGAAMADLALLLLVFFMATTSTEPPKGVEVILPKAKTEGAEQDSIYISVSSQGDYYYEGEQIGLDALQDALIMRAGERDRVVAVTADRNLNYDIIRQLLDVLRASDFLNVVFMAEPREGEE